MTPKPIQKSITLSPDARKRQVTVFDLNYTAADHGCYFVVTVHRTTPGRIVRAYYHPSRASLLRANRAQRLLIRRVVDGYIESEPAEPVRMCADPNCLNAADPAADSGAFCLQHAVEQYTTRGAECGVTLAPESTTELAQIITTEFEAAADSPWAAAEILRREG